MANPFPAAVLFFSLLSINSYGQHATFANEKMNKVYLGLANPVSIAVEGHTWSEINATTDNGTITKNEKEHCFICVPHEPGACNITVNSGTKKIASYTFRAYTPPPPYAKLPHQYGDSISVKRLKDAVGIVTPLENFDYLIRYRTDSFRVTGLRDGKKLGTFLSTGGLFSAEAKEFIAQLLPGDKILIDNVSVTANEQNIAIRHKLEPVTIRVVPSHKWDNQKLEDWER